MFTMLFQTFSIDQEKRREEARHREAEVRREVDMKASHEMQMNGNGQSHARNGSRAHAQRVEEEAARSGSWLGSLVMFLLGLGVAGAGLAISLLWIYTEGKLDSKSVSAALPVIQVRSEIIGNISNDGVTCAGRCGGLPDDRG